MNKDNLIGITSVEKYNQFIKRKYPNQIAMLFRTLAGNDKKYGYVLYKYNRVSSEVKSAHWFKRKMDAQYILDTKNYSTLSTGELIEWSFGGKQ